jgi:hypothetical protein
MTDYAAQLETEWSPIVINPPGRSNGSAVPPPGTNSMNYNIGALELNTWTTADYTVVAETKAATGTDDYTNVEQHDAFNMGDIWFETFHLLPRRVDGVAFGNIVTQVDEDFELFNAFRYTTVTVAAITNNATPGVTLPDTSAAPFSMGPFESLIDPSSPALAPVGQTVRAAEEGLPSFDTTIDFAIGGGVGTLYLYVSGNRISLLPIRFSDGMKETLEFKTNILPMKDGKEQRIEVRPYPRQLFEGELRLDGQDRQVMQSLLFGWQGATIAFPVWTEAMILTSAVTGGAVDTVDVDSTSNIDLREGALAVVWKDATTYDVLEVDSSTGTTVTFDQTIAGSYSVGDLVVPVRLTYIDGAPSGSRPPLNMERIRIKLVTIDNYTGAPTGDTSAFSTYDSKVLLDDPNFVDGEMSENFQQPIFITDGYAGTIYNSTPWSTNKRTHTKGFSVKTREDLWNVRRLLYALSGRRISFFIPSFMEDLTVTQTLSSGSDTMDIAWIGYARFVQDDDQRKVIKITFTDGTSVVREIDSSTQLSATEERLTLDDTWPSTKTADQVQRVQFYEPVRIDTDSIEIVHGNDVGRAKIFFPVKAVKD